jgi:hypothetical protein
MNQIIYLIGQISSAAPESYDWRKRVREYFSDKENGMKTDLKTEQASIMPPFDPFNENKVDLPVMVISTDSTPAWEIIDPCHNAFNNHIMYKATTRREAYEHAGVDLIVPKDRMAVKRSSICFANFHRYDPSKALIGTMFELAWYADSRDKAVIGIFDGNHLDDEYCRHPFVRNAVHTWFKTEIDACKIAERYFGG